MQAASYNPAKSPQNRRAQAAHQITSTGRASTSRRAEHQDRLQTDTIRLIDRPTLSNFTADKVIGELEKFGKDCIIQTMFLRGEHDGNPIDNTTPREVTALIEAYRRINPREVMIYSIDRTTPAEHLEKVSHDELNAIARRITSETGIPVQVA